VFLPIVLVLLVAVVITGLLCRRADLAPEPGILRSLPVLLALFPPIFTGFLLVSISFYDAGTLLNRRILSPLFLPGLLAVMCFAFDASWALRYGWRAYTVLAILATVLLFANAPSSQAWIERSHDRGLGYSQPHFKKSPLMRKVRALPQDLQIYTNAMDAVYILAGRDSVPLPGKYNRNTLVPNEHYDEEMAQVRSRMKEHRAVVVYFTQRERESMALQDELLDTLGLKVIAEAADGAIYSID
jgi:hypothetical protein